MAVEEIQAFRTSAGSLCRSAYDARRVDLVERSEAAVLKLFPRDVQYREDVKEFAKQLAHSMWVGAARRELEEIFHGMDIHQGIIEEG